MVSCGNVSSGDLHSLMAQNTPIVSLMAMPLPVLLWESIGYFLNIVRIFSGENV